MRREILNRMHEGQFGIVKTLSLARTCVFWPGISKDIKEMIEKCPVCAKFQISNAPESELPHEFLTSPWVKVAIDFFYFNGRNYVEVVYYYSKFIEVQLISSLQATVVIPVMKSIFARYGILLELISDGGPPFNSRDFDCFAKSWTSKHVKVNAKYPITNGSEDYSTSDTIPESILAVRPQDPVNEPASDSQSNQEPSSRIPVKGPYRTR
ncbi:Uncharacterized protein K02A2.6 [Araneus ventricosus]|uniref:RNA-directed DNA polymerase n=1 Tax=Araneus ventricosus TaxID=182803 RepID=A0A4Y2FSZ0_ARAVE|nr:Uncharacterized protein K02A2.6 [Araneus ventricosus]